MYDVHLCLQTMDCTSLLYTLLTQIIILIHKVIEVDQFEKSQGHMLCSKCTQLVNGFLNTIDVH